MKVVKVFPVSGVKTQGTISVVANEAGSCVIVF